MQNFLSSRKKMSSSSQPEGAHVPSPDNTNLKKVEVAAGSPNEAKIELVTENGVISAIIVNCKCGERIELKCHY